jgi:hypothetical protein
MRGQSRLTIWIEITPYFAHRGSAHESESKQGELNRTHGQQRLRRLCIKCDFQLAQYGDARDHTLICVFFVEIRRQSAPVTTGRKSLQSHEASEI